MKAKTILGLIACVGACATFSAFGNTTNTSWFAFGVAGATTVGGTSCSYAYVDSADAVVAEDGFVSLDNDKDHPLRVIPTSGGNAMSTGIEGVYGTAILTPSNTNDFEVTDGAKAGFAVGIADNATNFYGYASGNSPAWIKLSGTPTPGATNEFTILLNYKTHKVSFYLGHFPAASNATLLTAEGDSSAYAFPFNEGTSSIVSVDAFGSGSVKVLGGEFEVGVASYGDVKYGSLSEAIAAANGATNAVACVSTNGVSVSSPANGLQAWECVALGIDPAETLKLEPASADNMVSDKITLKAVLDYITFPSYPEDIITGPDPAFDVKYQVYEGETAKGDACTADAVRIPMGTGQYTVKPVITPKN